MTDNNESKVSSRFQSALGLKLAAMFLAGGIVGALSVAQVIPAGSSAGLGDLLGSEGEIAPGEGQAVELIKDAEGRVIGRRIVSNSASGSASGGAAGGSSGSGATVGGGGSGSGSASGSSSGGGSGSGSGGGSGTGCSGGATATGVSPSKIALAATVVETGIGADFLGQVRYGMDAIKNKVNSSGGICNRNLVIHYLNDGWDAASGQDKIRNFIAGQPEPIFALVVVPSSEGLRLAIQSGDIRNAGIPVVGPGGMLIDEYKESWSWPVAVSSASSARIMALNAYNRMTAPDKTNAASYSIVFDNNYRFGAEAAEAFNNEVRRLTGSNVPGYTSTHGCGPGTNFCGVVAGQPDYGTQVQNFQKGKFVAMFLEPVTALSWMSSGGPRPSQVTYGVGGAQPLFTRAFAVRCQSACDGMWVWTGYKPYIESYVNDGAVKDFALELASTKPDADVYNQFTEGGYLGMQLLVEALKKVGPSLTRSALRDALNSMSMSNTLSMQSQLSWSAGNHFPAATMRAFEIQYKGTFGGWREEDTASDPNPQETAGGL